MVHAYNLNTLKMEAGRWEIWVTLAYIMSETLSQKTKTIKLSNCHISFLMAQNNDKDALCILPMVSWAPVPPVNSTQDVDWTELDIVFWTKPVVTSVWSCSEQDLEKPFGSWPSHFQTVCLWWFIRNSFSFIDWSNMIPPASHDGAKIRSSAL